MRRANVAGALLIALLSVGSLLAAPIQVGSFAVDDYSKVQNATRGGANFIIHYLLNAAFDEQDCCLKDNLRWLQLIQFNPNQDGFLPGQFVDPSPGQNIGGGQTGDMLPWYDITSNTLDFSVANRQFGKGAYLGDGPFADWTLGSLTFTAETLLVCILNDSALQFVVLGGVTWGFSNDAPTKMTTLFPLGYEGDSAALRGRINTALGNVDKFKTYSAVDPATAWPGRGPFVVVPEPGCMFLIGFGLTGVVAARRRRVA